VFEHRAQPLLPRTEFLRRLARHGGIAALLLGGSLALGVLGYHVLEGFAWVDALLDAAMILGGMGPVHELHTVAGKLFASGYALFSGVVFLTTVAIVFAPVLHRALHRFHLEEDDDGAGEAGNA
jgi:hypothetical protein